MLDAVDRSDSLLVVAPTSAGKTFVSYYTMKAVLEENKRRKRVVGRAVMLVPTKALVLQTMGDLYLRYRNYVREIAGAPAFATWSRDFRDPGFDAAQILVTVHELLLLKLENPADAEWVRLVVALRAAFAQQQYGDLRMLVPS
jgi:ATP-dependent RNA helicase DDX60